MLGDWRKSPKLRIKTNMVRIVPGILATKEVEYAEIAKQLDGAPALEDGWVQIDLMDGEFVDNKSISPEIVAKYPLNLKKEAQLMVEYPDNWIDDLVKSDISRIVFPVEDQKIDFLIEHIKKHGKEVGLSINPETPVENVETYLDQVDVVLIMSVKPGFGGQDFIPESVERVSQLSRLRRDMGFIIEVDGGITPEVVPDLIKAGADNLVIGASRLITGDLDENLEQFWEATQQIAR